MRSREDTEHRLKKLTDRYKNKFVSERLKRKHTNCSHNYLHVPDQKGVSTKSWESSLAPRKQVTLVVIQPESPIGICLFGSNKPNLWNGDVCDDDSVSESCPNYDPLNSKEALEQEFDDNLKNDEWTLSTYPDIAALQWVLNTRVWEIKEPSFFSKFIGLIKLVFFVSLFKRRRSLPAKK